MRILAALLFAAAVTGCVTVVPADTPALPTDEPPVATDAPTPPPTPEPQPTPTAEATPAEPTPEPTPEGTPDPNATPRPSVVDLVPFLSSEMTVVNLADEPMSLKVTLLDPESDGSYEVGTFNIEPLQVTTQSIVPTRIRLEFTSAVGAHIGTCTIDVAEEEAIQFAVIGTGIAITTPGAEPEDPAELSVATASRCRAGEAT